MAYFLYLSFVLAIMFFLTLSRSLFSLHEEINSGQSGLWISWLILTTFLAVNVLNLQTRDMSALATQGLSTQNKIQVMIVALSLLWGAFLLISDRIRWRSLFYGPGYWLFCLLITYTASTLWSTWPTLSMFRVAELAAFWLVTCHIFARHRWFDHVERFLWLAFLLFLTRGLLLTLGLVDGDSSSSGIVGLMRTNSGSLIAGILIIWHLDRYIRKNKLADLLKLPFLTFALILFGSLATAATLVISVIVYLALRTSGLYRVAFLSALASIAVIVPSSFLMSYGEVIHPAVQIVSTLFSKPVDHITGMTGRLELWRSIWDASSTHPWGFGFAAIERMLSAQTGPISWTAGNAHNGFVSAFLGAGWLAVALLLMLFGSIAKLSSGLQRTYHPLMASLLTLLIINNLTLPAIGGRLTVTMLFVYALIHASKTRISSRLDEHEQGSTNNRINLARQLVHPSVMA